MSDLNLTVSSSPHFHAKDSVRSIMGWVCIAMLPACIWGVYCFGINAACVLLISVASAVLCEYLFSKFVFGKKTTGDLSALVTGILVGMNMPPSVPLFVPFIASAFAIIVVKMTFGGLGNNFANPAIAGRIFVFFSFTALMSSFVQPHQLTFKTDAAVPAISSATPSADTFTSATPLSYFKANGMNDEGRKGSLEFMKEKSYPVSHTAYDFNRRKGMNPYIFDAFFGNQSGCIGEVSAFLILLGGILLLIKKIISCHIPLSYLASYALFEWVFGGLAYGGGFFQSFSEVVYALLTGGIMLCAFFMATDMVTSPLTHKGQLIFGVGLGFFTFLFRRFSSLPEGVSVALLLMNVVSVTINKYVRNRVMGVKK